MATAMFKPQPPPRASGGAVVTRPKPAAAAAGGFQLLLQELQQQVQQQVLDSPRGRQPIPATARPGILGDITNAAGGAAKRQPSAGPRPPLTSREPHAPKPATTFTRLASDVPSAAGSSSSAVVTPRDQSTAPSTGLPTAEAIAKYASCLTLFEAREIFDYPVVYYCGQRCTRKVNASPDNCGANNHGFDDAQGDYKVIMDDQIAFRYEVLQPLGRGSFGQVSKAFDHKTKETVALKIIKNKKKFHEQALIEVKVLKHLNSKDADGSCRVVRMLSSFVFRNHMVIAFELHGQSLYDLHKSMRFAPMTEASIRCFGRQILQTLVLTHREHVVHCDLKPENILLESGSKTALRVIDFGSACFDTERLYTYIQSRFYRAPEVLLGIPYTPMIDMWSLGCMLAEFAGGYPLFPGESEVQQMQLIMETMGLPPRSMLDRATRKKVFFDATGAPKLVPSSRGKVCRPGTKNLADFVRSANPDFVDVLRALLTYEPHERMSPAEALRHPFFGGTAAATSGAHDVNVVLPKLQPSKRR